MVVQVVLPKRPGRGHNKGQVTEEHQQRVSGARPEHELMHALMDQDERCVIQYGSNGER
jgi:hypothetical protein